MASRVVVTGLGARSAFGAGAEALVSSLRAGRRALVTRPELAAAGLPPTVALLPGADPLAPGDRAIAAALEAAEEAVAGAGGVVAGETLGVAVGTTLGAIGGFLAAVRAAVATAPSSSSAGTAPATQPTLAPPPWTWSAPAEAIARRFFAHGPVRVESVACASANAALGAALADLRAGRVRQVIAGGVDTLTDFVLAGFGALKATDPALCRPFDRARAGLNLGEGACFLVLEDEDFARARGAPIRAVLAGYGVASDAHHMTGPDPEGRGAARAMRAALDDAGLAPGDVEVVSAHGTSTVFNDLMEHHALRLVLGDRASIVPVNSIKGALGHTLGAAGAFEALLCVRQLEESWVAPTAGHEERDPEIALDVFADEARALAHRVALSTSSGFGGVNAAIVLTRP